MVLRVGGYRHGHEKGPLLVRQVSVSTGIDPLIAEDMSTA